MKRILLLAILFISFSASGQGNLQFNRVLNFKSSNSYTVPVGKVLKIVSINALSNINVYLPLTNCNPQGANMYRCGWGGLDWCFSYFTDCQYGDITYLTISNQKYNISSPSNQSLPQNQCSSCPPLSTTSVSSSAFNNLKLPIWLAAGEEVSLAQIDGLLISAIEFNIIP